MKTIVIHPEDTSTDFLKEIYRGKPWDIVTDLSLSEQELLVTLATYDRIILMGHGSPHGLFGGGGLIITEESVPLLLQKETVCIWCHADKFVKQHGLTGFYTGMFISEIDEALYCGVAKGTEEMIEVSNLLFAQSASYFLDAHYTLENILALYRSYDTENPIIEYNRKRLYT